VQIKTYCNKTHRAGFDAKIGCGECHPLPPEFLNIKLADGDDS
jgi:hypothetical protein